MNFKICPYCGGKTRLNDSYVIYGISYGMVYTCENYPKCDSYVGVHKKTLLPLGYLADKELRELRIEAHSLVDPLWQLGFYTRKKVYKMIAKMMRVKEAHISWMYAHQLNELIDLMREGKWKDFE